MSEKINVLSIVRAHLQTLRHHARNEYSIIDITVFLVCPALLAILVFVSQKPLTESLVNSMISASAILLGLLLNLLVLMFDQRNRAMETLQKFESAGEGSEVPPDREGMRGKLTLRIEAIRQTVANISFTVLLCIASLCTLLLYLTMQDTAVVPDLFESLIYAANVFIWVSVSLTILMVIKRVFALFVQTA